MDDLGVPLFLETPTSGKVHFPNTPWKINDWNLQIFQKPMTYVPRLSSGVYVCLLKTKKSPPQNSYMQI